MNNQLLSHISQALEISVGECRKGFLVPYETEENNYNFTNELNIVSEFVEQINTTNNNYHINLYIGGIEHNSITLLFKITYL